MDAQLVNVALVTALRKLAAEVGGLGYREHEIRAVIGNTNWSVLQLRLTEAEAALKQAEMSP